MIFKIIILGLLMGLGLVSPSEAAPLTRYDDQASWNAAVAGLAVGSYNGGGTVTITTTTISTGGAPDCPISGTVCVISTNSNTFNISGLSSIQASMSYPYLCFDCTATTEIDIILNNPVLGFYAMTSGFNDSVGLNVNGVPLPTTNPNIALPPQFFGLVGPISELVFKVPGYSDSRASLNLKGIMVATVPVPEPFTLAAFGTALGGLIMLRRQRKTGAGTRTRST